MGRDMTSLIAAATTAAGGAIPIPSGGSGRFPLPIPGKAVGHHRNRSLDSALQLAEIPESDVLGE
jgi:hypothetical protein